MGALHLDSGREGSTDSANLVLVAKVKSAVANGSETVEECEQKLEQEPQEPQETQGLVGNTVAPEVGEEEEEESESWIPPKCHTLKTEARNSSLQGSSDKWLAVPRQNGAWYLTARRAHWMFANQPPPGYTSYRPWLVLVVRRTSCQSSSYVHTSC
jgi:hypothetical protein